MRTVTHCPACQTEFFVTDEQLKKHNGKVRCGQCMHVFDATEQIVELEADADDSKVTEPADKVATSTPAIEVPIEAAPAATSSQTKEDLFIGDYQPSNFADLADKSKIHGIKKKPNAGLWVFLALILLILAAAQSVYFLRSEIAIYYPGLKPYLVKACAQIRCTVDLPKKIEFIVIDDSDMQEDADHTGVMRLTSTLINQAPYSQAYPKLELTLTDADDQPKLRRIFLPNEYLPPNSDIEKGLAAGEEVKVKLALSAQGQTMAGYRVYVTY